MERIVRTMHVEGHEVAVVEIMVEEGSSFLLCVDDTVINADAPLLRVPADRELEAAALRWTQPT